MYKNMHIFYIHKRPSQLSNNSSHSLDVLFVLPSRTIKNEETNFLAGLPKPVLFSWCADVADGQQHMNHNNTARGNSSSTSHLSAIRTTNSSRRQQHSNNRRRRGGDGWHPSFDDPAEEGHHFDRPNGACCFLFGFGLRFCIWFSSWFRFSLWSG